MHNFDDFDAQVSPEEFDDSWENYEDDNPIDSDFDGYDDFDHFDEGSDRDNWEDQQVFLDNEG